MGILLAWVPWIPIIIGLREVFRGVSGTAATGLAGLAAGFGEGFALWGVAAMVIAQVVAIVWLGGSTSREHWSRNFVSVVSIVLSGLMLVLVCLFVASLWFLRQHPG